MKTKNGKAEIITGIVGLYLTSMMFGVNFSYNLGKTHDITDSLWDSFNIVMIPLLILWISILVRGIKAAKGMKNNS